jgi:hypothetical protein
LLWVGVLLAAAVVGDAVTKAVQAISPFRLLGLLADNWTHACLAGLCWWVVLVGAAAADDDEEQRGGNSNSKRRERALEVAAAVGAGSLLDLDHFFAARSPALDPALSLPRRPFGHCLATLLVGGLVVYSALRIARAGGCCCLAICLRPFTHNNHNRGSQQQSQHQQQRACRPAAAAPVRWPLLGLTATLSHQLRDSVRRGLWLLCWGRLDCSTPPLPYPIYLALLAALPLAVRRLLAWAVPAVDIPPAASYRRVGDCDWEAEWGDQESEEDDEEDGVELPVVIV